METRDESTDLARRELVLVVVLLVALTRLVPREVAFVPAVLASLVVLVAGVGVIGTDRGRTRPIEALLIPAVLAGGAGAALQLVPAGLGLLPALAVFALLFDRFLALELRLLVQASGVSDADRSRVALAAVVTAFVAFTGVAALVPGGLAEPGGASGGGSALTEVRLLVLALADALIALVLGYRVSAFRYGSTLDGVRSAITYAIVIGVTAGAVRAIDLPRLVGPAVLTLVFYLWDALHGSAPARRREPRFLWETLLLAALALVVVAWNLRLRA